MYHRFIEQISEFIFAEDEPEKADACALCHRK
mgnify:CR=1 FL=1